MSASPLDYLALKTPYPLPDAHAQKNKVFERCRSIHINHVGRHGSRHMGSAQELNEVKEVINQAQQEGHLKGKLGSAARFAPI